MRRMPQGSNLDGTNTVGSVLTYFNGLAVMMSGLVIVDVANVGLLFALTM